MESKTVSSVDHLLDRLEPQILELRRMVQDHIDPLVNSLLKRVAELEERQQHSRREEWHTASPPLEPEHRRRLAANL